MQSKDAIVLTELKLSAAGETTRKIPAGSFSEPFLKTLLWASEIAREEPLPGRHSVRRRCGLILPPVSLH